MEIKFFTITGSPNVIVEFKSNEVSEDHSLSEQVAVMNEVQRINRFFSAHSIPLKGVVYDTSEDEND